MKAQKWVLVKHFDGVPKDSDLELQEEILPELQDGDVLFEAVSLSVDPYMRLFSAGHPLNTAMLGEQVAKVSQSKHPDYKEGDMYLAGFGWRTHTVVNMNKNQEQLKRLPDFGGLPVSLALGILGMPGVTAYCGLLNQCEAKQGEVVLVTGAAGAVGNVVGQIAKLKGCTVIGSAGTDEKIAWLKKLGFDHVFNYKKCNLSDAIKEVAPDGVDIFFDNVGGVFTSTVVRNHMKMGGRILLVGNISGYNSKEILQGPLPFEAIMMKTLRIQGFLVYNHVSQEQWLEAQRDMKTWITEGKLKYREHVTKSFENMRAAFYGLFRGENTGKAVVNILMHVSHF